MSDTLPPDPLERKWSEIALSGLLDVTPAEADKFAKLDNDFRAFSVANPDMEINQLGEIKRRDYTPTDAQEAARYRAWCAARLFRHLLEKEAGRGSL